VRFGFNQVQKQRYLFDVGDRVVDVDDQQAARSQHTFELCPLILVLRPVGIEKNQIVSRCRGSARGLRSSRLERLQAALGKKRNTLYSLIHEQALVVGVGVSRVDEINEIDFLQLTLKRMTRAVARLSVLPDFLLVDGITTIPIGIEQKTLKQGDSRSLSITAASVIAKVVCDASWLPTIDSFPNTVLPDIKVTVAKSTVMQSPNMGLVSAIAAPLLESRSTVKCYAAG